MVLSLPPSQREFDINPFGKDTHEGRSLISTTASDKRLESSSKHHTRTTLDGLRPRQDMRSGGMTGKEGEETRYAPYEFSWTYGIACVHDKRVLSVIVIGKRYEVSK